MVPVRFLYQESVSLLSPKSFISCLLGKWKAFGTSTVQGRPDDDLGDEGGSVWTVSDVQSGDIWWCYSDGMLFKCKHWCLFLLLFIVQLTLFLLMSKTVRSVFKVQGFEDDCPAWTGRFIRNSEWFWQCAYIDDFFESRPTEILSAQPWTIFMHWFKRYYL